jgi:hypothetical protein
MIEIITDSMDRIFGSARQVDQNGYVTIAKNPISKSGVFPYLGRSLPEAEDPNKIYYVLRPEEELCAPETISSFKMIPIIDDHVMLGDGYETAPEQKGIHGSTGDDISFENGTMFSNLRIFSKTLKGLIDAGKKGLSLGYRCAFEKSAGVFNGIPYDYIQKNIRGNHLALVQEGRMGTEVLDHHFAFDHFDLALDLEEKKMGEEATGETEKKEMTLAEISQAMQSLMPLMAQFQEFMAAGTVKNVDVLDEDDDKKECDDKKKSDAEDEDDKEKEKDAMDAIEFKARLAKLESRTSKDFMADIAARDKLARDVSQVVGTFDHSEMSAMDVADYAIKKLNLSAEKGQEAAVLSGFLAGRKATASPIGYALDARVKPEGKLAKRLNGSNV